MTKQEALSFLLTCIVVEKNHPFQMTTIALFELMSLADEAITEINNLEDAIPHEILESYATRFIDYA